MNNYQYGVGIDPGWKNLGFAIVRQEEGSEEIQLVYSEAMNPSERGIVGTTGYLVDMLNRLLAEFTRMPEDVRVNIERYVPYNNVMTAESENITMLIGSLMMGFSDYSGSEIRLFRAIDWKMNLVKALFKWKKFSNPSIKLDKKFSIAAAQEIVNVKEIETDHEADAICLASLGFIPNL
jgi:Holliday junction resolvasome RuvABC endonuclease subunit